MYKVELKPGFPAPYRNRAGISVSYGTPFEGALTAEQVEAIKADGWLVITEQKTEAKAKAKKTEK